MTKTYV